VNQNKRKKDWMPAKGICLSVFIFNADSRGYEIRISKIEKTMNNRKFPKQNAGAIAKKNKMSPQPI
jgi:hypothetical protein